MATYSSTSTGGTFDYGYIHARVEAITSYSDTSTSVTVTVKCYAVPTYSSVSSSWLKGKATKDANGNYGEGANVTLSGSTILMKTESFSVTRGTSDKTITCRAYVWGYGGGGMYDGDYDTASVSVTIPKLKSYVVSYDGNKPSAASGSVSGLPGNQTKWQGINLTLSRDIPSLTNYNFKGWADTNNGSVVIAPGVATTYSGNTNKTYYAIWELAYILPSVTNVQVFRTTENSSTLSEEGTFMRVNFSWSIDTNVQNTGIKVTISAKPKGTLETAYKACITDDTYEGTNDEYGLTLQFKNENNQSAPFSTESSYDIKIEVTDTYGGTTIIYRTLSQSYVLLDFSPSGGIGMGVTAPETKQLELGIGFKHSGDSVLLESVAKTAWINALGLGVEVIADNGELIVFRCGPVVMIQIRGITANTGTTIGDGTCANYKPKQNASAILGTAGGTSDGNNHYCRCWVSAEHGSISLEYVDYSGPGKWYGTLTYITSAPVWNSTEIDPVTVTMLTPRVLYSSTPPTDAGNTGPLTITLNESAANYNYMRIYYSDRVGNSKSVDIYQPQGKKVALDIINGSDLDTVDASRMIWLKGSRWSIDGTSITKIAEVTHDLLNITTANTHAHNITKTQHIFIWRVEAWGPVL